MDTSNHIGLDHQLLPHKEDELEDVPWNQRSLVEIFVPFYKITQVYFLPEFSGVQHLVLWKLIR